MTKHNAKIPAPLLLAVAAGPPAELLVDQALDAVAEGTFRDWLRHLAPVARRAVLDALRGEHAAAFARAKAWHADMLADETLDIADDRSIPTDRARLLIEARWRRCAALHPEVYGDRKYVEHSGTVTMRTEAQPAGRSGMGAE